MRYYESREQSAELLRMVLPLMSRHSAGFHPLSYAVWYEYVAGTNHALKAAMDEKIAGGRLLNEEDIKQLFDGFVAVRDIESTSRLRGAIQKVVEQVNDATARAASEVSEYSRGLTRYQEQLAGPLEQAAINEVVASLRGDTDRIQECTDEFSDQLARSNDDVGKLTVEIEESQGKTLNDPLTGLLNQRGFERYVRQRQAAGYDNCTLVLASIDNLPQLIHSHGRLLGDRVIAAAAQAAKTNFEPAAQVARVDLHAFAALLEGTPIDAASLLADRLRVSVERGKVKRIERDEAVGGVTLSAGVAGYINGEGWESLLRRAQHALERAAQGGGNRIVVASAE